MGWSMLRSLLILALIFNLVPSVGEVVEMVVHRAIEGHWAHSVEHQDEQPGTGEHGCSPMAHLCHCCPSQTAEREQRKALVCVNPVEQIRLSGALEAPLNAWTDPPFRPPIA